jgi:hypothetical protein
MKTGGFKHAVVLGLAASALLLGGCRNERGQGAQQGVQEQQQPLQEPREAPGTGGAGDEPGEDTQGQPDHLKQVPDEEGFQSVPEEQEAPSGIGLDGRGGSGEEQRHEQEK